MKPLPTAVHLIELGMTPPRFLVLSVALKITGFFAIWVLCWCPFGIPLALLLQWQPSQLPTLGQKLPLVGSLYLLAPLVLWQAARIEGVPLASYGFPWDSSIWVSLGMGLGLGLLGLSLRVGCQLILGGYQWQAPRWRILGQWFLPLLLMALGISLIEEWVFRGFLVNQLLEALVPWGAALVSSLIFAGLHLVWEGKATLPQLPGLWLMGLVLCLARWVDQDRLGIAWGLHSSWVWGIASLDLAQILTPTGQGPNWLQGTEGKPLAGVLSLCLILLTGGVLWLMK